MFRCPKCNSEQPADSRFCAVCGFNQTNARLQATIPPRPTRSGSLPDNAQKQTANPVTPITPLPPTPPTMSSPYVRSVQPEVKRTIPPRTPVNDPARPGAQRPYPSEPPPQATPANSETIPSNSGIRPVRTNTPPRPGMESLNTSLSAQAKVTPAPDSVQMPPSPLPPAQESAMPAHLAALASQPTNTSISTPPMNRTGKAPRPEQQSFPAIRTPMPPEPETLKQPKAEVDEAQARSLSLKQRYLAEQATTHHAAHPSLEPAQLDTPEAEHSSEATESPRDAQAQAETMPQAAIPDMTIINQPTISIPAAARQHAIPELELASESLAVTSKAAEHWRSSWRDRQRAEAGPALGISRGQAAVPEPLMAMQHSIARMRAVVMPQNKDAQAGPARNFGFWVTLILLVCLVGGLGAYVIWTYLPPGQLTSQISAAGNALPSLTTNTAKVRAGQALQLHGEHFGAANVITFILDQTALHDDTGKQRSVQSNSKGSFDTVVTIPTAALAGNYALLAQDNQTGQHAFLNIQVLAATTSLSNTTALDLTLNGQPVTKNGLTFKAIKSKADPAAQQITLRNTGAATIQWSTMVVADNNLNWLVTTGKTGGNLAIGDTDNVSIGVVAAGLQSSTKAYTGKVIFTAGQTQAIVPISLSVQENSVELVINPDPIVIYVQGGNVCVPATLTLINLSNQLVSWNANSLNAAQTHINLDNQGMEQGTLQPSGQDNDTKVLKIFCNGTPVGEKLYHITVYYNGTLVDVPVSIRRL